MSWSRESVVAELKEFDWSLPDAQPGPELSAYSAHYHLVNVHWLSLMLVLN